MENRLMDKLMKPELLLEEIRLYFLPVDVVRVFSFGSWPRRYHGIVEFSSNGQYGYGEICIPDSPENPFDAGLWRERYAAWNKCPLASVLKVAEANRGILPDRVLESVEMAFFDLAGRLLQCSATELLGLPGKTPTPGLYCILQHEPERLRRILEQFLAEGPVTHLKLKLFGNAEHDAALIGTARRTAGETCYITGDVNCGYPADMPSLIRTMKQLHAAGLNGCEDPAPLDWNGMRELQEALPELNLIPDELMRPAYRTCRTAEPLAGMICNLHPDSMGSLTETVALGRRLKSEKIRFMIGDDSLIGPGCSAWQQIACGLGAEWVEALEKPRESTAFTDCVLFNPVRRDASGLYRIEKTSYGFGLEVDREKLSGKAGIHQSVRIQA